MFINQMKDGWGLATDGQVLFGSDGASTLYQIDPQTMKVVKKYTVKYKGDEVNYLNELEYVAGEVWANVWQTNYIARISGKDGLVLGWIYLPKLRVIRHIRDARETRDDERAAIGPNPNRRETRARGEHAKRSYFRAVHTLIKG